jgi:hypothetical protein
MTLDRLLSVPNIIAIFLVDAGSHRLFAERYAFPSPALEEDVATDRRPLMKKLLAFLIIVLALVPVTALAEDSVLHSRGWCETFEYERHVARLVGHIRVEGQDNTTGFEIRWAYARRYLGGDEPGNWTKIAWRTDGWKPGYVPVREFDSRFRSPFNEIEDWDFRLNAIVVWIGSGFQARERVYRFNSDASDSTEECKVIEP